MRLLIYLLGLSLWTSPLAAQRLHMPDLFHCLRATANEFDACMFRQGFICYQSTGGLAGLTCLFAYQPTPLRQEPDQASAIIQFDRNSRSDILTYQVHSRVQYDRLRTELIQLGFRIDPVVTDRELFVSAKSENTIVSCHPAMTSTGMSGNYKGYIFTLTHRRY